MSNKQDLAYYFMVSHPTDAARVMERQETDDILTLLQNTPPVTAAAPLQRMDDNVVAHILDQLEPGKVVQIMAHFPIRTTAVLLRRMENKEAVLDELPQDLAADAKRVIQYPEGTAGGLMEPRVFTVTQDVKIADVLETVQRHPEYIKDYLYVVSRDHVLVGVCSLNRMLSISPDHPVVHIMHAPQHPLSPHMTYQAILEHPGWQFFHDLPVVDLDGVFLGVISYRDMRRLEEGDSPDTTQDAGTALGELYWLGLSAFIKGAGGSVKKSSPSRGEANEPLI